MESLNAFDERKKTLTYPVDPTLGYRLNPCEKLRESEECARKISGIYSEIGEIPRNVDSRGHTPEFAGIVAD